MEQPRAVLTPMEMIDRALSANANVETLTQLMNLQERWEANQARKAFDEAMASVKAVMPRIVKNKKVDFTTGKGRTNYQYEDLASIMDQIGPVLSQHGLSVRYRTQAEPNQPISVTCIISHRMGHSEENTLMAGRDDSGNKNSIQAIGSTVTYLQRYTLKAALGLAAAADDDGGKADETADDMKLITEAQASVIRELIEQGELDTAKFCERWQIEAVTDIPMKAFNEVVGSLRQRVAYIANQRKQGSAA
jgi:polyhydroxyalkanoate synthesis regulator phasin